MRTAARLGVAAMCAVALSGCEAISFDSSPAASAGTIRVVSRQQARVCRLISKVVGESAFPPDDDLYTLAFNRARDKAAEQAANAMMVDSYQVQTGPSGTHATLTAEIYACSTMAEGG